MEPRQPKEEEFKVLVAYLRADQNQLFRAFEEAKAVLLKCYEGSSVHVRRRAADVYT